MPFLSADDGARLWYRLEGDADAPLLVLSHSLGTDLTLWDPQMAALRSRFRVLRYDLRGHGQSETPSGPYAVERLGRDVAALLDGLGAGRAHFCGLSLGGMIGMWCARHLPDRIDRLVLCNTAARIGPPELWDARMDAVRAGGMAAIVAAVLDRWFTPAFRARAPAEVERCAGMLRATPVHGYLAACAAIRDMDQREQVAAIRAATLVIAGSADRATPPADGRFLADRVPGAGYLELAAAHLSNIEAADGFTTALVAFLTGRGDGRWTSANATRPA